MKATDLEILGHIAEFEVSTNREHDWPNGWCWRQVQVWPGTLNRLCLEGYLRTEFRSNSYTGYILTEKARAVLQGAAQQDAEPLEPIALPDDLFHDIIGHDDVKELLRACMSAARPVHVLLAGPPALAKSLFLWELERVAGDRASWVLGSSASKAGLLDVLLGRRPWLALIDEVEKLAREDQAVLLSAMEGGRLTRTKVGKIADVVLDIRVVAACNRQDKLAPELLSRFAVRRLHIYSTREYLEVVTGVLTKREGCSAEAAGEIAQRLTGRSQDVRDAIRVARLAPSLGVEKAIRLLLG
ncbi:MAG: ATP-dependent helicase-like protein [Dehalococcoidales bacterium]|nr:ATP-dependent helicase-like protein [Dehalococcoidales bacterium]